MIRGSILKYIALALIIAVTCIGIARADGATPGQTGGPRIALVVGNSEYGGDLGVLANPVNDARLLAKTLKVIGFDVIEVENADQNAMKRAIADFGDRVAGAGSDATSLFFYAGHGLQVGGQNYLIPVHANISRERDVDIEAVSIETVLKQMAWADSKVNIVILDACRNNPLARGFRSATKGLAEITTKPQGSFISYSTSPGDVAVDGNGANSPFSAALADAIARPGLDINDVFREVRGGVMSATKGKQVPWDSSSLTAPYYFVAPAPAAPAAPAALTATTGAVDPKTIELTFWAAIKDSKSPDDFQAYLEKYPEGDFAGLAKLRIKQLGAVAAAPQNATPAPEGSSASSPDLAESIELTFWETVKDSNAKEDLEAYLKKYPNGHFADLAQARIATLDTTRTAALTPPPAPVQPAASQPAPAPLIVTEMDATFVARQSANVRAEPGTDAKVIARLKEDDAVAVTGKVDGKDWYRAKLDDGVGYVSAGLLQQADAEEIAAWQAAKNAATPEAVQGFMKQHPDGVFGGKAKKLLAALQLPPAPQPAQAVLTPTPQPAPAVLTPTPAPQPATPPTAEAAVTPEPSSGMNVGDKYDVVAKGLVGIRGGWWGNTRVTLEIETNSGEGQFEGKLTGSGQLNFWEKCDIVVEGENVVIRGTESSVDNRPDILKLKRVAPDRYEGKAQSGSFSGVASMTLKSRG